MRLEGLHALLVGGGDPPFKDSFNKPIKVGAKVIWLGGLNRGGAHNRSEVFTVLHFTLKCVMIQSDDHIKMAITPEHLLVVDHLL